HRAQTFHHRARRPHSGTRSRPHRRTRYPRGVVETARRLFPSALAAVPRRANSSDCLGMRVLFYLGDKQWTGSSRAALMAARGLVARGHQVTLACCGDSRLGRDATAAEIETIEISTATTTF